MNRKLVALSWVIIASLSLSISHPSFGEMNHGARDTAEMEMHHLHILLNHGITMVTEGSNLVMLARMGMAGEVDRFSLEHGERMISHARNLYREAMDGEAMKRLRDLGVTPESSPMMKLTRDLAEAISKIIELLARMPAPSSMATPAR